MKTQNEKEYAIKNGCRSLDELKRDSHTTEESRDAQKGKTRNRDCN